MTAFGLTNDGFCTRRARHCDLQDLLLQPDQLDLQLRAAELTVCPPSVSLRVRCRSRRRSGGGGLCRGGAPRLPLLIRSVRLGLPLLVGLLSFGRAPAGGLRGSSRLALRCLIDRTFGAVRECAQK